jgi:hypothetical protein
VKQNLFHIDGSADQTNIVSDGHGSDHRGLLRKVSKTCPDPPPQRHAVQAGAAKLDCTRPRAKSPSEDGKRRALAGTVGTKEAKHLPRPQLQIDPREDLSPPIGVP